MTMQWVSVDGAEKPAFGQRVLVCDMQGGKFTAAKRTSNGWIDDNAIPIKSVTHWAYVEGDLQERMQ